MSLSHLTYMYNTLYRVHLACYLYVCVCVCARAGWGVWGGEGVKPAKKQTQQMKPSKQRQPRKDDGLDHVIISEHENRKIRKHLVSPITAHSSQYNVHCYTRVPCAPCLPSLLPPPPTPPPRRLLPHHPSRTTDTNLDHSSQYMYMYIATHVSLVLLVPPPSSSSSSSLFPSSSPLLPRSVSCHGHIPLGSSSTGATALQWAGNGTRRLCSGR